MATFDPESDLQLVRMNTRPSDFEMAACDKDWIKACVYPLADTTLNSPSA